MNIDNWLKKSKNIKISKKNKKVIIENKSDCEGMIFSTNIIKCKYKFLNVDFKANILSGSGARLSFINKKRERMMDVVINSETSSLKEIKNALMPVIVVKPNTKIEIEKIEVTTTESPVYTFNKYLGKNNILLITPSYPSPDNLYACGFVHSRVKEYKKCGLNVDVATIYYNNTMSHYNIEGVDVFKTDYSQMRSIIMSKRYDAILVHFFDSEYAYYLDTSYIEDIPIIFWNHGADILYWNCADIYTPYFENEYKIPEYMKNEFKKRDKYLKKFLKNDNIKWVFVSEDERKEAQKMHNDEFKNSIVIHNVIDNNTFKYEKKDPELRKKIFMTRRFDNYKKYAIDIAVLTILELSRRDFFNDLEFYICGEGNYFEELVQPIRKFNNVKIIKNFMTHNQLSEMHKKCGIALFPTRQDTQGVSALEAASSGLAVITSDLNVIHEFFDEKLGLICSTENIKEYADKIEFLYNNPNEFMKISEKMSEHTREICNIEETIHREIKYINDTIKPVEEIIYPVTKVEKDPLLTIVVPSYNAEKFLNKCIPDLLKSKYSYLTEVLIINDGSKDHTAEIGRMYEKITTIGNRSIVKLIDKKNGGHGSGINKGIEIARGKYFKVVDADDWLDIEAYDKLLEKLQNEDVDMVLTEYCEARSFEDKLYPKIFYNFLTPDVVYHMDDIAIGTYGFRDWGPSLPTATYKTEKLREANFKLLEKTFYVDMLYNAYSIINIDTVKKYDLNLYRYYIGNIGQSVSKDGMMKNYKHHENVILELMNIVQNDTGFTPQKREFVLRKLLLPMVSVQYYINLELFHSGKKFRVFEKRIKAYPEIMKNPEFNIRHIKFHRATKGMFVGIHPKLLKIADILRRGKGKVIRGTKNVAKKILRRK